MKPQPEATAQCGLSFDEMARRSVAYPRLLAERAELVAALRLGRSAEDHLKRQALLRRIEGAE